MKNPAQGALLASQNASETLYQARVLSLRRFGGAVKG